MKYFSTRDENHKVSAAEAISRGLAPDGGLFVPEFLPQLNEEDMKALYNRVIAKDKESYDLHEKAKEMQKLFHVNESAFDPRHDRECELEEGYMHRAYMMSGLRSFAWTLADYCKQHDCTPEDIDNTVASRIANFVANEDWLNYDCKCRFVSRCCTAK